MNFDDAKAILLEDAKLAGSFRKKDLNDLKIHVGLQILELRLINNLTQKQLAKKIGTAQPGIARAERGATLPSLTFLHKIAVATKTELIPPKFASVEQNELVYQLKQQNTYTVRNIIQVPKKDESNWELNDERTRYSAETLSFGNQVPVIA